RLVLLASLIVVAYVAGQCNTSGRGDHFRCAIWVKTGFCDQVFYSEAQKQAFCGTACGLCPETNCGAIYLGTTLKIQTAQTVAANAATAIPAGSKITKVYAVPGCSMHLLTDPTPPAAGVAGIEAIESPFAGTGMNVNVTGTPAEGATAMRCTCP
ncbi:hypothetical protein PENTCL1PPCAC_20402, partial [Pristionchus entomophagus]